MRTHSGKNCFKLNSLKPASTYLPLAAHVKSAPYIKLCCNTGTIRAARKALQDAEPRGIHTSSSVCTPLFRCDSATRMSVRASSSKHLTESSAVLYSFQSGMFTTADFLKSKLAKVQDMTEASCHLQTLIYLVLEMGDVTS